ncbi:DUF2207 family protein [Peptococcus simiae]|uniref:DUF2207 family protein n=1 Tax=Peptococcus simiae TaxID=1643805 RepID=UPI00397F0331
MERLRELCRRSLALGLVGLLTLGLLSLGAQPARANDLTDWQLSVVLQPDGSAQVTERRQLTVDEGTEAYIALGQLQGAQITDFRVEEKGQPFTDLGTAWDVNASREEKAGKSGIIEKEDGVELCWGLGADGDHTYTVHYTIHGIVRQLTDGQSMFWTFYNSNTNTPPERASLEVRAPFSMTADNTKIWGFGFEGQVNFDQDGRVIGQAQSPLSPSNHITLLFQFPDNPFQPGLTQDMTLADQEAQAKEGSSYGSSEEEGGGGFMDGLGAQILAIGGAFGFFLLSSLFRKSGQGGSTGSNNPFRIDVRDVRARNKDKYYRDIPYEGPLEDIVNMLRPFDMAQIEDLFNAYLLTWLAEGRIGHQTVERGVFRKRDETTIVVDAGYTGDRALPRLEAEFYDMVVSAAGQDGILEAKEFAKWSRRNAGDLEAWWDRVESHSRRAMNQAGYVTVYESRKFLFRTSHIGLTEAGAGLVDRLIAFKNYLEDFTLLDEREISEVGLWQQLLIWAGLYGMADEVAKALEDLYPELARQVDIDYTDIILLHHFSAGLGDAYRAATAPDLTASSGGGGFTSIGGGGGGFGGGGGGGTR